MAMSTCSLLGSRAINVYRPSIVYNFLNRPYYLYVLSVAFGDGLGGSLLSNITSKSYT